MKKVHPDFERSRITCYLREGTLGKAYGCWVAMRCQDSRVRPQSAGSPPSTSSTRLSHSSAWLNAPRCAASCARRSVCVTALSCPGLLATGPRWSSFVCDVSASRETVGVLSASSWSAHNGSWTLRLARHRGQYSLVRNVALGRTEK